MHSAHQLIRRFLAAGLIAAHLLVITMAMCPDLHHWMHGDADEPDHDCAVTAMIDGQFDRPDLASVAPARPIVFVETREPAEPVPFLTAFSLSAPGERAPPAA